MDVLRRIGIGAEAAMMRATGGINTHRGAIFGLGLLCAAAGARTAGRRAGPLGTIVATLWGDAIRNGPIAPASHGTAALRRYGAGGARQEAAAGFQTVYTIGLPALREGIRIAGSDAEATRLQCLFALMAAVGDTALLHRGGRNGLAFAQRAARGFLTDGGVGQSGWRDKALLLHRQFVARRLSAGGCADLLAMTLFVSMMPDDALPAARQAA
jgi:triphosphoribosyl-dephospho-CoA synthase